MKKKGSTSDFATQRDKELYAAFRDILCNSRGVALADMFGMAAKRPASRFWVSEERAAQVVSWMLRGASQEKIESMVAQRRAMFEEIYRRVRALMADDPSLCMTHAVNEVVASPAPEFYLSPKSARVIIYRIRARRKQLLKERP